MWVQPYFLTPIINHASCAEIMTHRAPQAPRDLRRGLLQAGIPFARALGGRLVAAIDGMRFVVPVPASAPTASTSAPSAA